MKVRCICHCNYTTRGRIYEVVGGDIRSGNAVIINNFGVTQFITKDSFEIVEEVEVKTMKKTFKEVIADIKEGEVWESYNKTMWIDSAERITIQHKGDKETPRMCFDSDTIFILQRKKIAFTEAFKAYEEGKEIESCYTDYKYKKIDGVDQYMNDISVSWHEESEFQIDEIRGEWYINA